MPRFLLLTPRDSDAAAATEYRDFLRTTGLREEDLHHRRLGTADSRVGSIADYAGVFVGGSPLNMLTPKHGPWQHRVIQELSPLPEARTPSFSVCFGATLLASTCGGTVATTHPEIPGRTDVSLTADAGTDPIFGTLPARFEAITGHTENAATLPDHAVVLATGPTCPIQALRVGAHAWATQFHPELDGQSLKIRIDFYRNNSYFPDEEYDSVLAAARNTRSEAANSILRRFVQFCRES